MFIKWDSVKLLQNVPTVVVVFSLQGLAIKQPTKSSYIFNFSATGLTLTPWEDPKIIDCACLHRSSRFTFWWAQVFLTKSCFSHSSFWLASWTLSPSPSNVSIWNVGLLCIISRSSKVVLNLPSCLVKKTHPTESRRCCEHLGQIWQSCAARGVHNGALSCHFLKHRLFIQRPVHSLGSAIIQQILCHTTDCRCWPTADINQERHLDRVLFLPQGAPTCWAPHSVVRWNYTLATLARTWFTSEESNHISWRALKVVTCTHVTFSCAFPPCVSSSALIETRGSV